MAVAHGLEERPRAKRLLFPLAFGILGTGLLLSLCYWQVQRLDWKRTMLAEIDARISGVPVPLPEEPDPATDNYLPVVASGSTSRPELFVLTSRTGFGPGFRVVVPFETGGRRVLLDRGFVPEAYRDRARHPGKIDVVGNLHWPRERDRFFTPEPEGDLWFAREVPSMANELATEPVMIVARNTVPATPNVMFWPVQSDGIPNNHLNYAITWFLMAVAWTGMTIFWLRRIRNSRVSG